MIFIAVDVSVCSITRWVGHLGSFFEVVVWASFCKSSHSWNVHQMKPLVRQSSSVCYQISLLKNPKSWIGACLLSVEFEQTVCVSLIHGN